MMIEGGISSPSVPEPASVPDRHVERIAALLQLGHADAPIVAQVTAEEPATAAMMPQPSTLTCSSRPGSRETQGASPWNMSADNFERNRISPIQMKSGSEVSAQPQLESQSVEAISDPIGAVVKSPIITMPTVRSESATQTPLASSRSRERGED
jgi:hypothetical protein